MRCPICAIHMDSDELHDHLEFEHDQYELVKLIIETMIMEICGAEISLLYPVEDVQYRRTNIPRYGIDECIDNTIMN